MTAKPASQPPAEQPCHSPYAIPRSGHISATDLRATIGGVEYRWYGGFGAVIMSEERGVMAGETRVIGGILFHVNAVDGGGLFGRPEVSWTIPASAISMEWVRAFKQALFGAE